MQTALRYLAILANALFLIGVFVLFLQNRPYGVEYVYFLLLLAFATLNLLALCTGPDREERQLRRQVNKAELKKRLKDLNAGLDGNN